jgi:hypothetical protein
VRRGRCALWVFPRLLRENPQRQLNRLAYRFPLLPAIT